MATVSLWCSEPSRASEAEALATELSLPLVALPGEAAEASALLVLTAEGLELRALGERAPGAVAADFAGGTVRHRRLHGQQRGSPLARAIGARGGATPSVLDATTGLGRDAFVLASLGCRVRAVERSPVIFALVRDAWRRGQCDPAVAAILGERLTLECADARAVLAELAEHDRPDAVLIDPMYPLVGRKQKALVKKEMRVCRLVTGDDVDAEELLALALGVARRRVVVKRPRGARHLSGQRPTACFEGKTTRFDAYMTASR